MTLEHPVIGIRGWYARPCNSNFGSYRQGDELGLWATSVELEWKPGVNEAVCFPPTYSFSKIGQPRCPVSPGDNERCKCGLHAYHDVDHFDRRWPRFMGVAGIVRGWGAMHVHPNGWRAQYAEVLALISGASKFRQEELPVLAEHLGVPVVPMQGLSHLYEEFGKPVPQELRPERAQPQRRDLPHPIAAIRSQYP